MDLEQNSDHQMPLSRINIGLIIATIISLIVYGWLIFGSPWLASRTENQLNEENIVARDISQLMIEAHRLYLSGDYKRAEEVYSALLKRDPKNEQALLEYGITAYRNKKMNIASEEFSKVIELSGEEQKSSSRIKVAAAHYYLGEVFASQSKQDLAMAAFQKCIKIDPVSVDALLAIAKIDIAKKRNDDAIEILQQALRLEPESYDAYVLLEKAYTANQNKEKAIEARKEANKLRNKKGN